jgi:hypothetical protein
MMTMIMIMMRIRPLSQLGLWSFRGPSGVLKLMDEIYSHQLECYVCLFSCFFIPIASFLLLLRFTFINHINK